jgi:hypothetical protein
MKRLIQSIFHLFRGENGKTLKLKAVFITAGIASTVWFLIRVIPKPQRALYPCMRAAAPVMSSFVVWALSVLGMMVAWRKAKVSFINSRYLYTSLFGLTFLIFLASFVFQNTDRVSAMFLSAPAEINAPIGTSKGIFPGRVAWVYNPNAAKWTGSGNYWAASVNPQAEYNKSFTAGINSLSGGTNDAESWDKIFNWFNDNHGRLGTGYQTGDKIAIKINQNNSASSASNAGNTSNANPQSCVACVQSLVNAGVPQNEIWIGDPSRAVTDNIFTPIHTAFPNVHVVDYFGNNGRETTTVVANVFTNNDVVKNESSCFYNARYIINMPLFKGHDGQGITFGSKNFYGINGIKPVWSENGGKHPFISALTNYMTNPNFGGKTILWVMDAMYPNKSLGGTPDTKWTEAPFNGRPASSFIMSLDGVAEESVSLDFFNQHYSSIISANGGLSNAEGYLHNAANAKVGVHEHWNNSTDRKYSRNLNPAAAEGIELAYVQVFSTGNSMKSDDLNKYGISLFNSGDGFIRLNMKNGLTGSKLRLELFSLQGASVLNTQIVSDRNTINISQLDRGIYVYKLYDQEKSFSGKIMVTK